MKNNWAILFILVFLSAFSFAGSHSGTVSKIHLNKGVSSRGVCIQMSPSAPTSGGWLCLYGSGGHLYSEMTSLILMAYSTKIECTVTWFSVGVDGHASLDVIEC